MKIEFHYSDGDEDTVILSDYKAKQELMKFLNGFSDCGKRQWVSRVTNRDYPNPLQDAHYDRAAKLRETSP